MCPHSMASLFLWYLPHFTLSRKITFPTFSNLSVYASRWSFALHLTVRYNPMGTFNTILQHFLFLFFPRQIEYPQATLEIPCSKTCQYHLALCWEQQAFQRVFSKLTFLTWLQEVLVICMFLLMQVLLQIPSLPWEYYNYFENKFCRQVNRIPSLMVLLIMGNFCRFQLLKAYF